MDRTAETSRFLIASIPRILRNYYEKHARPHASMLTRAVVADPHVETATRTPTSSRRDKANSRLV